MGERSGTGEEAELHFVLLEEGLRLHGQLLYNNTNATAKSHQNWRRKSSLAAKINEK
jgi:hypothetical protein